MSVWATGKGRTLLSQEVGHPDVWVQTSGTHPFPVKALSLRIGVLLVLWSKPSLQASCSSSQTKVCCSVQFPLWLQKRRASLNVKGRDLLPFLPCPVILTRKPELISFFPQSPDNTYNNSIVIIIIIVTLSLKSWRDCIRHAFPHAFMPPQLTTGERISHCAAATSHRVLMPYSQQAIRLQNPL